MESPNLPIRNYAHLGDAVYEVFVREIIINENFSAKKLHELTIKYVNGAFQMELLKKLDSILTEEEADLVRRARNTAVPTARRISQATHRQSTAFEALIGFLYLNDKARLNEILDTIKKFIEINT